MKEMKGVATIAIAAVIIVVIIGAVAAYVYLGAPGEEEEIATLRLWHTYSPHEENTARALLDEFEADNPNIKVTLEAIPYGEMRTKLMTAIAAGMAPDLLRMDIVWVPEYADMGALLEISDYMAAAGISSDDFYSGPFSTCVWKDNVYGLPLDTNTRVLIYRKDLLQEEGVSVPTTWDEFLNAAKALTKDKDEDGVTDQWGFAIQDGLVGTWQFGPFLWQAGGSVLNPEMTEAIINNEAGYNALKFLVDLVQVHKVAQEPVIIGGWPGQWGMMAAGEVAMMHDGPWFKGILEGMDAPMEDIEIALKPKGVQEASVVGGEDLVIFTQSKHPDAAWKVMEYMTSKEFQLEMSEVGQIPTLIAAGEDPSVAEDPFWGVFIQQLETARARPVHPKYSEMDEIIHRHLDAALAGVEGVQEALDAMAAEINELL